MSERPELGMLVWRYSHSPVTLERLGRPDSGWRPANLRKEGFAPSTVIDVGAGEGTLVLYKAFPDAYHVLIEPLVEHAASLQGHLSERNGEHIMSAIGDEHGSATLHVHKSALWGSSILDVHGSRDGVEARQVPVTTLDRLAAERAWRAPYGLKIDTEGYEKRVLAGATQVLRQTQFVIAEVSVARRSDDSYGFAELIAYLDAHGFSLCDILEGFKGSKTGDVLYIDAIFRKSG